MPINNTKATEFPAEFGPTFGDKPFPDDMRRQLWPLCCGASIISGFKRVNVLTDEELLAAIQRLIAPDCPRPDFQVFVGEQMRPTLTFLTLNANQLVSPKIMNAIKAAGFFQIGEAKPRGGVQGFFLHDASGTWKNVR